MPVGLFGLVTRTTSGACSAIAATRRVGVDPEVRRAAGTVTQAVWVLRAYSGYIE